MGRIIKIELDDNQRQELENGYRNGNSHSFRTNCHLVLLKSEGRKSTEIASFLGITEQKVNRWLWRYKIEGSKGLEIRTGRGRPSILQTKDTELVKASGSATSATDCSSQSRTGKDVWVKNFQTKLLLGF